MSAQKTSLEKQFTGWILLTAIAAVVSLGLFCAKFYYHRVGSKPPLTFDAPSAALDRTKVAARSYVDIKGKVAISSIAPVYSNSPNSDYLFTLAGERNLIFFCPHTNNSCDPTMHMGEERKFTGRIYDYENYAGPGVQLPTLAIWQYIKRESLADKENVRIVDLGETPAFALQTALVVTIIAVVFAAAAIVLAGFAMRTRRRIRAAKKPL